MSKFKCCNKSCGQTVDVINSKEYVIDGGDIYCNHECYTNRHLPKSGLRRVRRTKYKKSHRYYKWLCPVCGGYEYLGPPIDNLCRKCKMDGVDKETIILQKIESRG